MQFPVSMIAYLLVFSVCHRTVYQNCTVFVTPAGSFRELSRDFVNH